VIQTGIADGAVAAFTVRFSCSLPPVFTILSFLLNGLSLFHFRLRIKSTDQKLDVDSWHTPQQAFVLKTG
jgi:hypothetical protein